MTPRISAIAAISKNRVIGKDNGLIWAIPEDLRRFKQLTTGHAVIMGRKTYESIGKPLPNRTNIIITRDKNFTASGCIITNSLDEAFKQADNDTEIFVIGGGQIYEQALSKIDRLYLTVIDQEAEGDTYFPAYDNFTKVVENTPGSFEGLHYTYLTLEK